ncbi:jg6906 [Pararge aegeria aegeria]|uniref:Jg6906 protein n=1 Tax=Pararge aegeria aegeria TaxID=348720 RepID=A0A8S4S895_9NEOP|nr:jg6906 [Pararge aegeria aegeria]
MGRSVLYPTPIPSTAITYSVVIMGKPLIQQSTVKARSAQLKKCIVNRRVNSLEEQMDAVIPQGVHPKLLECRPQIGIKISLALTVKEHIVRNLHAYEFSVMFSKVCPHQQPITVHCWTQASPNERVCPIITTLGRWIADPRRW